MTARPFIQPQDFERIFAPRPEPEAHHASMMKLAATLHGQAERLASDHAAYCVRIDKAIERIGRREG